jgi:hypothetical protein
MIGRAKTPGQGGRPGSPDFGRLPSSRTGVQSVVARSSGGRLNGPPQSATLDRTPLRETVVERPVPPR